MKYKVLTLLAGLALLFFAMPTSVDAQCVACQTVGNVWNCLPSSSGGMICQTQGFACAMTKPCNTEQQFFHLSGTLLPDGSYEIVLAPSDIATEAILVHTKPSNTLILAAIDNEYKNTREGKELTEKIRKEAPRAFVESKLPDARPTIVILPPPLTDTSVSVTIYGDSPARTKLRDFIVAEYETNIYNFSVSTRVIFDEKGVTQSYLHCVTCDPCGTMCVTCSCAYFSANCITCTISCNCGGGGGGGGGGGDGGGRKKGGCDPTWWAHCPDEWKIGIIGSWQFGDETDPYTSSGVTKKGKAPITPPGNPLIIKGPDTLSALALRDAASQYSGISAEQFTLVASSAMVTIDGRIPDFGLGSKEGGITYNAYPVGNDQTRITICQSGDNPPQNPLANVVLAPNEILALWVIIDGSPYIFTLQLVNPSFTADTTIEQANEYLVTQQYNFFREIELLPKPDPGLILPQHHSGDRQSCAQPE